jgi:putative transposase
MDGKVAWRDNVFVERLWRSVEPTTASATPVHRSAANSRSPHSSLDGMTPDQAYSTPLPLRLAA